MDRAAAAEGLWDRVLAQVDALADDDWDRPTPCPDWSVHDVVTHLAGVQTGFDGGPTVAPPPGWEPDPAHTPVEAWAEAGVAARRSWDRGRVRAELAAALAGHVARLQAVTDWSAPADGPIGRTTEDSLFGVRMFDVWVHLQDLRAALELPPEADDTSDAARAAHGYVWGLVPWLFARRAGAQEGATMRLALGAPLHVDTVVEVSDGKGRLNPAADPGICSVTGSPAGLTLLATGRRPPAALRASGLLDWTGPRGAEFVERARMF
jgi:uncharacterized protein (TIGR03083 family)